MGRTVEVETYSGSALPPPWGGNDNSASTGKTVTSYPSLKEVVTTDPGGVKRKSIFDGLGRLAEVIEDPDGQNLSTKYTYDFRDSLLTVEQKNTGGVDRARTFVYSSLGRLLSAENPESGTISYAYDNNGNLVTRTEVVKAPSSTAALRGAVITMEYDALNRVTAKTYPGNKVVSYSYDAACPNGWGRLCSVTNEAAARSYQYDTLGRVTQSNQQMGTDTYVFKYQYNLTDGLTEVEYPGSTAANPVKVGYGYTQAGRINQVYKGAVGSGVSYASGGQYFASGAVKSLTLGNGVVETTVLNSRQQVQERSALAGGVTLWRMQNLYSAGANNGNVTQQTISGTRADGIAFSFQQSFTYDALNRLRTMNDSGIAGCGVGATGQAGTFTQVYVYARWGNRGVRMGSCNPGGAVTPVVGDDTAAAVESIYANNTLAGANVNSAVNAQALQVSGNKTLSYDAENRLAQVASTVSGVTTTHVYSYDGEGHRVKREKLVNEVLNETTKFVYDAGGQLMAEYADPAPAEVGTVYVTADHLGTTRLTTKASGAGVGLVASRHDYLPFGEEIDTTTSASRNGVGGYGAAVTAIKFTGKERDAESGPRLLLGQGT